jgi:uncharacterized protein (TIGR03000 family)
VIAQPATYAYAGSTTPRARIVGGSSEAATTEVATGPAPARLTVRLPAEARLFVDGVACPLTSATRTFRTPNLEPGRRYYYTLRADLEQDGQVLTQSRRVAMTAGRLIDVRFNFNEVSTASR